MDRTYEWLRIRSPHRGSEDLLATVRERLLPSVPHMTPWGIWSGLLGIGSNELIVMASTEDPGAPLLANAARALPDVTVVQSEALIATARPTTHEPLTRPGLYVFRFFAVDAEHVDEMVALSQQAWTTFEATDTYAAQPQGLFAPAPGLNENSTMLLLTWYDNFTSWEASRTPHPDARANFARRHALTRGTIGYATRLVS